MGLASEPRTVLSHLCAESDVPGHQVDFFTKRNSIIPVLFDDLALVERVKIGVRKSLQNSVLGDRDTAVKKIRQNKLPSRRDT